MVIIYLTHIVSSIFRVLLNLAALFAQLQSSITKFSWMPSGTVESKSSLKILIFMLQCNNVTTNFYRDYAFTKKMSLDLVV